MASMEMETLKSTMKMMMEKGFSVKFDGSLDPLQLRAVIENAQRFMSLPENVRFDSYEINGIGMEKAIPEDADERVIILYIHGGGFVCGNAETSRAFAASLAMETGIPVYTVSYRLAPENPYPAGVQDCFSVYRGLSENNPGKKIFLIGESAGATLCLVSALKARDEGSAMPAGIILYSPLMDFSNEINRGFEGNKDFTVTPASADWLKRLYCSNSDSRDPYVSPLYADLKGLCPVYLSFDESESLSRDALCLIEKASEAGVELESKSFPDCFHAFATTGRGTPESSEILDDTIAFIKRNAM